MSRTTRPLPSPEALIQFLRDNPGALGTREIARAFGLGPAEQSALRDMMRRVTRSGELVRAPNRKFAAGPALPEITPVERFGSDADGVPLARPVAWQAGGALPSFRLIGAAGEELAPGEHALARLIRRDSGEIDAEIIRRLDEAASRVVGVFRRTRDGGEVIPGRSPRQGRVPRPRS